MLPCTAMVYDVCSGVYLFVAQKNSVGQLIVENPKRCKY